LKNIFKLNSPIFAGMSEDDITSVLECLSASEKRYPKKAYIWHAGDSPDYIGLVVEGQVNIIKEDFVGNRIVIANIMPSHVFGESYFIAKVNAYPVSTQAATDSIVVLLKCGDFIICLFNKTKFIIYALKSQSPNSLFLNLRIISIF